MTEQNLPGVSNSDENEVVVNTDADVVVHAQGDVVEPTSSDENIDLHLEPGGEGQVQVQPGPGQHLSRGGQVVDDEEYPGREFREGEPRSEGAAQRVAPDLESDEEPLDVEEVNPAAPDPNSPSARHVKELRKREIKRHQAAAPVAEQIRIQLAEAGLA